LTNLHELEANNNWLTNIENIGDATNLHSIDIRNNLLTGISEDIMNLDPDEIYLGNNCRDTNAMSSDLYNWLDDHSSDDDNRHGIFNDACYNDPVEVNALIDLYNATGGPTEWDSNDNW